MPTIMFWNVQGSGGDTIKSKAGDLLLGDLSNLTADEKPDLVVLCELKLGFETNFTGLGSDYTQVLLPKNYPKKTTYRFGLFVRAAGKCVISQSSPPELMNDGNNRPALSVVVNNSVGLLAVHPPSVSQSITAQMQHLRNTVGQCTGNRVPKIIFGDFNMDLLGNREKIATELKNSGPPLSEYRLRPQPQHTQSTHVMGKALDWALVDPAFSVSYRLADAEKSDHWPICITWR